MNKEITICKKKKLSSWQTTKKKVQVGGRERAYKGRQETITDIEMRHSSQKVLC